MTCIVGIIEKEKVYIGGDSAGVGGARIYIRKDKKVFLKDNKFIIGFTSSFRMGQLLMCDDRFKIREQNKNESDYHFMINAFIPSIQKLFKAGGYLRTKDDGLIGGVFLIGYNKNLYLIESDFQVGESTDNYMACGCGEDFALGSLFATQKTDMTTEQRILNALEAASKFSTGVAPPFNILQI